MVIFDHHVHIELIKLPILIAGRMEYTERIIYCFFAALTVPLFFLEFSSHWHSSSLCRYGSEGGFWNKHLSLLTIPYLSSSIRVLSTPCPNNVFRLLWYQWYRYILSFYSQQASGVLLCTRVHVYVLIIVWTSTFPHVNKSLFVVPMKRVPITIYIYCHTMFKPTFFFPLWLGGRGEGGIKFNRCNNSWPYLNFWP